VTLYIGMLLGPSQCAHSHIRAGGSE